MSKELNDKLEFFIKDNDFNSFRKFFNIKFRNLAYEECFLLRLAVANNRIEFVKLILKNKYMNPCVKGCQAINVAYENKNYSLLKLLIQNKNFQNITKQETKDKYNILLNKLMLKEF